MKNKMKILPFIDCSKWLRKTIYFAIAALGCLVQVYFVGEEYLKYAVATDISVTREDELRIPGMAVCFNATAYEKKDFSGQVTSIEGKPVYELLNYTHDPYNELVVTNITVTGKGIFYPSNVTSDNNPLEGLKFMRKEDYCFAYQSKLINYNVSRDFITTSEVIPKIYSIRLITFWFEKMDSFKLYFYTRLRKFYDNTESSLTLTRTKSGYYNGSIDKYIYNGTINRPSRSNVAFTGFKSILLESPFETACRKYQSYYTFFGGPFSSQAECFTLCYSKKSFDEYKLRPSDLFTETSTDALLTRKMIVNNETIEKKLDLFEKQCSSYCEKQNCIREDFIPRRVSESNLPDDGYFTLSLLLPTDPDISVITKPVMSITEFVTYVLSCISFWFGFAPFSFLTENDFITRAHKYIAKKHSKNKIAPIGVEVKNKPPKLKENVTSIEKVTQKSGRISDSPPSSPSSSSQQQHHHQHQQYQQQQNINGPWFSGGKRVQNCQRNSGSYFERDAIYTDGNEIGSSKFLMRNSEYIESDFASELNSSSRCSNNSSSTRLPVDVSSQVSPLNNVSNRTSVAESQSIALPDRFMSTQESSYNLTEVEMTQEEKDLLDYLYRVEVWFNEREGQILELIDRHNRIAQGLNTRFQQHQASGLNENFHQTLTGNNGRKKVHF